MAAITPTLLPSIDISSLSHSNLLSLSLLSSTPSSSSLSSLHLPTNSSSFNESESTRRQTYSTTPTRRRGLSKQETSESASIVTFLKKYLNIHDNNLVKCNVEIVNRDGKVVDLAALEEREKNGGGGLYDEELRRRAAGRDKEEELLEALVEMEGEWCSWRMKRRIVSGCLLGDALPVGWKVVIALRRKGGRFSPYCRDYISPTGKHFSSCKEVSSYLRPYFRLHGIEVPTNCSSEVQPRRLQLQNDRCINSMDSNAKSGVQSSITTSERTVPIELRKDLSVSGIDFLPDVQIRDHYECYTCKLSFDEMDKYKQHLLLSHERTTKRFKLGPSVGGGLVIGDGLAVGDGKFEFSPQNQKTKSLKLYSSLKDGLITVDGNNELAPHKKTRKKRKLGSFVGDGVIIEDGIELSPHKKTIKKSKLGSSVADGVIIRDGKYECQFCDKVFEERRRYLGHVGNHVKGSIKCTKDSLLQESGAAKSLCMGVEPAKNGNSRMDALIVIAQSSIQDILPSEMPVKQPSTCSNADGVSVTRNCSTNICHTRKKLFTSLAKRNVGKCVQAGRPQSSHLNPCNEISRSSSDCHTETENDKDIQKDRTALKGFHSPSNKLSQLSVTGGGTNDSDPCPVDFEIQKDSGEANYLSGELYTCDDVRRESATNENILSSPSCQNDLETIKVGREDRTLLLNLNTQAQVCVSRTVGGTKQQAVTCKEQVGKMSCFDASMTPCGRNGPPANNSSVQLNCDSDTPEDEASAEDSEGDLDICFLTCDEKQSDAVAAQENFQSSFVGQQEAEHAQYNADHGLAGETNTFGCTASQKSFNSLSPFDDIFGKAGENICSLDANLENMSELEYMKLDAIQPQMYKYNAMSGEDDMFLPDVSMDLGKETGFDLGFNASGQSQTELSHDMAQESMTTTVCVWCGIEFCQEIDGIEPQPDSVGFMCPGCRSKISTQFTDLESNFSLNPCN